MKVRDKYRIRGCGGWDEVFEGNVFNLGVFICFIYRIK